MTPNEVATILRPFNKWRRGNENIPQPDPREIGEAIDAAVEMIERLEALRAELKAAHAMALNGVEWRELAQKYEAEIAAMKRQAPVAWMDDGAQPAPLTDEQIQDLLHVGNPTDEECRLIRLGWDAAVRAMMEKP